VHAPECRPIYVQSDTFRAFVGLVQTPGGLTLPRGDGETQFFDFSQAYFPTLDDAGMCHFGLLGEEGHGDTFCIAIHGCYASAPYSVDRAHKALAHWSTSKMAIVIAGNPCGLEKHLIADVFYTAQIVQRDRLGMSSEDAVKSANSLTEELASRIADNIDNDRGHLCVCATRPSGDSLVVVVWNPSLKELKINLTRVLRYGAAQHELVIVFCGHGAETGHLLLRDMQLSGKDLVGMVPKLPMFPPTFALMLNCCYAVNVVGSITGNADVVRRFFCESLPGWTGHELPRLDGDVANDSEGSDLDMEDGVDGDAASSSPKACGINSALLAKREAVCATCCECWDVGHFARQWSALFS
jgi:hypothetical protein